MDKTSILVSRNDDPHNKRIRAELEFRGFHVLHLEIGHPAPQY